MKEKFEQEQKDRQNHIEDLIPDMPDMEDDEKFRQWLEETYINEAVLIEKSLLAGQEYEKNPDIAEELSVPREKFYQRLKEEGLYEEADEPDDTSELSKKAVRGVGTEIAGDAVAKKKNASVSKTAREKNYLYGGENLEGGWWRSKGNSRFQFAREDRDSSSV